MSLGLVVSRNRTAILGLTALLAAAGLWAARRMPLAIFPEVAFHRISVIAHAGHLPVEQTLTTVTQPLEAALTTVPGLERIRSQTSRGGVQIDLTYAWSTDMLPTLQRVQAAMEEVRPILPAGSDMEARLLDTSAFPIVGIAVTSRERSLAQISDFVIYEAAPRFRTLPGVYRVELSGAKIREYALTVDPVALVQHRLDLAGVAEAVRRANVIAAGGEVRDGYRLVLTVVQGHGTEVGTLRDIVVADDHGVPVRLGDIAEIEAAVREDFIRTAANGETAVLIGVSRQPEGDTIAIADGVRQRLGELERTHPEYAFSIFYDQADLVRAAIRSVRDSILLGLVLAVGTIFVFIADLRATLVAAAVIPAAVAIACLALHATGMTFNLMTLGGIAAAIGLVLDDAIVVVENWHRHRALGESGDAGLAAAIGEIARPLVGSTLTPVAVLLPLALLGGVPGAFFRPLAATMSLALLVSLALAMTFTPALTAAVEPAEPPSARTGPGDRVASWLAGLYGRGLRWLLRRAWVALLAGTAVLAVAWLAYRQVETGFVPEMDEGAFVLDYWAPPGTSLDETLRMLARVDAILTGTPEVKAFSRRTGAELGFFLTETNRGDYAVRLKDGPRRPIAEVISAVRRQVHDALPGLRIEFVQILQDMIGDLSGNPEPVEVKLFGTDHAVLERTAQAANAAISTIPGIVDTFDGITEIGPTYRVEVDERRTKLIGLDAATVQQWLDTAITGTIVGQVLEGDRAIPLRLRYPEQFRTALASMDGLTLVTQGRLAPLESLARLRAGPVAVQRSRENLRQVVRVTGRLEERDLGAAVRDVQALLAERLELPAGVSVEYGGLYASQQAAFRELLTVFFVSLVLVSALLLIEFGSLGAVIAIVAGSSLALSGSLLALWMTGTALNVSSLVGMIMVVGIVAKNGILLLDFAEREYAQTNDLETALVGAGRVRLRPILMTSIAAGAGLAPLAVGLGAGAQMQQPLAIAILGGLSISMLFSLVGVPVLHVVLSGRRGSAQLTPAESSG